MSQQKKSKKVVLPRPMRMVWGALAAYWLRDIIHPAFTLIAVMILFIIPVLIANNIFPEKKEVPIVPEEDIKEDAAVEVVEAESD